MPTTITDTSFSAGQTDYVAELNELVADVNANALAVADLTGSLLTASSTTSLTIGTGSKSLTIETGRAFGVGQRLRIAYTTSPTNYMIGPVTSYNSSTGALVINVDTPGGSGTQAVWSVTLEGAPAVEGETWQVITGDTTAVARTGYIVDTTSAAITLTLPASATAGDYILVTDGGTAGGKFGTNNLTIARNGHDIMDRAENMTVSRNGARFKLVYQSAANGWRIA